MHVTKTAKAIGILALSIASGACSSEPDVPPDFSAWDVKTYEPYLYATNTYEAYGVNNTDDWTAYLHKVTYQSDTESVKTIRQRLGWLDYDGYGLHLGPYGRGRQIGTGVKVLPDEVYLYWESYNYTKYVTMLTVTEEMKTVMRTPHPHPRGVDYPCYQTTFSFGLLPDGRAKVWLEGCMIYTYVGEFEAEASKPRDDVPEDTVSALHAKTLGVAIEPIPWGKVNKDVLYDKNRFTMNTLEEALNESQRDH